MKVPPGAGEFIPDGVPVEHAAVPAGTFSVLPPLAVPQAPGVLSCATWHWPEGVPPFAPEQVHWNTKGETVVAVTALAVPGLHRFVVGVED